MRCFAFQQRLAEQLHASAIHLQHLLLLLQLLIHPLLPQLAEEFWKQPNNQASTLLAVSVSQHSCNYNHPSWLDLYLTVCHAAFVHTNHGDTICSIIQNMRNSVCTLSTRYLSTPSAHSAHSTVVSASAAEGWSWPIVQSELHNSERQRCFQTLIALGM